MDKTSRVVEWPISPGKQAAVRGFAWSVIAGAIVLGLVTLLVAARNYDPHNLDSNLGQGLAAVAVAILVGGLILPAIFLLDSRRATARKIWFAILVTTTAFVVGNLVLVGLSWVVS